MSENTDMIEREGVVYNIFDEKEVGKSDKPLRKREMVLEVNSSWGDRTYTDLLPITFLHKRVDNLAAISKGDTVRVGFKIKGREWVPPEKDRDPLYFLTLDAVWINNLSGRVKPDEKVAEEASTQATNEIFDGGNEPDDLPF